MLHNGERDPTFWNVYLLQNMHSSELFMLEAASPHWAITKLSQAASNIIELKQQWREEEGTCSCNWRALRQVTFGFSFYTT